MARRKDTHSAQILQLDASSAASSGLIDRPARIKRYEQGGSGFHDLGDTPEKERQRAIVSEFILPRIKWSQPVIFSLPGERWTWERHVYHARQRVGFVACEKDSVTWGKSLGWMPREMRGNGRGRGGNRHSRRLSYREWWFEEEQDHITIAMTASSASLHTDAWRYFRGLTASHWKHGGKWWKTCWCTLDAIWYDAFSPLGCSSYGHVLQNMHKFARPGHEIPVALSFMIGRDQPEMAAVFDACPGDTPLDRRAAFIDHAVTVAGGRWKSKGAFSHDSWNHDGSVKIGTVLGLLSGGGAIE